MNALLLLIASAIPATAEPTLAEKLNRFLEYTAPFPDGVRGSVLVAKNGKILVERAWGLADAKTKRPLQADSLFDIASATKQFTAALALRLQMEGKLKLDDPLSKYFPGAPADKASVTLRQLLNHTSGISNTYDPQKAEADGVDFGSRDSAIGFYLKLPMVAKPGTEWAYSNLGYNLVAAAIEKATGLSWEAALRRYIFGPAGLKDTWCLGEPGLPENRVPLSYEGTATAFPYGKKSHWAGYVGAGGVHATVRELFNWDRALRGESVLSRNEKEELYRVGLNNYALGWETSATSDGKRIVSHGGAVPGFLAQFTRGLDDDIVVVILVNNFNIGPIKTIAATLYDLALTESDYALPGSPSKVPVDKLRPLTGTYAMKGGATFEVAAEGSGLVLRSADWASGSQLAQNAGFMIGGITVPDIMDKALTALKSGDASVLEGNFGTADDATKRAWTATLAGGASGKIKAWKSRGAYFTAQAEIDHFLHVDYENGVDDLKIHWKYARIYTVEKAGPWIVSVPIKAIDERNFVCDVKTDSWQRPSVRFKEGAGDEWELTFVGTQTFSAKRTAPGTVTRR